MMTEVQRFVLEFFDSTDFSTKRPESGSEIQEIVYNFSSMHEATGGKVQKEKEIMLIWK